MIYPIVHLYVPCPIGKQQACLFKGAPDKSVEIKKNVLGCPFKYCSFQHTYAR